MVRKRELNVELVRILAMLLIFLSHINTYFLSGLQYNTSKIGQIVGSLSIFIMFHVDLFLLITGYFGVRNSKNGIVKTCLVSMFYTLLLGGIYTFIWGGKVAWSELMPFSRNPWWFMHVYLILLLIAPLLERFIEKATKREFYMLLLVSTFINVYLGWIRHCEPFESGHGIFNFINVYLLGCWLRMGDKYVDILKNRLYVPMCLFLVACFVRYAVQSITFFDQNSYASPLNLIMAICVFCMFLRIKVPDRLSKAVLFLSSSAVSVYLITDYERTRPFFISLLGEMLKFGDSTVTQLALMILFVAGIYVLCCAFDKVRMMMTTPMQKWLLGKLYAKIEEKLKCI